MPITVERVERKQGTPGYNELVDSLETAYNVQDAGDLKWVDVKPREFGTPRVLLHVQKNHPDLSVLLRPENEDGPIMGEVESYQAPILLVAVDRWGSDLALRDYKIDRWRGKPGPETMFPKSTSLAEIIANNQSLSVTDSTPVVEVVSLLPMAPNGEYQTQFVPKVSFDVMGHKNYQIAVISENALSAYVALSRGSDRPLKDRDETGKYFNWTADSVRTLSDVEQLMLPSSHGHMILIASPIEALPPPRQDYIKDEGGFRDRQDPNVFRIRDGGMKRATVGRVSLGRGSQSGQGSLYKGELHASKKGNTIIYHVEFLGVTPEVARALDTDGINQVGSSLSQFERN